MRKHDTNILYRFFTTEGALLYVGMTCGPSARFQSHRRNQPWWREVSRIELEHYDDREALQRAEKAAIKREDPVYNKPPRGNKIKGLPAQRPTDPRMANLYDAQREVLESISERDRARERRDQAVSDKLRDGWTHQQVADATGLTRGRIGQIAKHA